MDTRTALKWTAIYKGIAWLSGAVGLALVVLPIYFYGGNGLVTAGQKLVDQPLLVLPVLLGLLVWQVGKTAAYYGTVVGAVDAEIAERFDPELIKSDILSVLDERLAEMQTEVEETRRAVEDVGSAGGGGGSDFDFQE